MKYLAGGLEYVAIAGLLMLAYGIAKLIRGESPYEVTPSTRERIRDQHDAQERTRHLIETRPAYRPTLSDGPPTKALSRTWDESR